MMWLELNSAVQSWVWCGVGGRVTTYMRNEGEGRKMSLYFDDTLDRTCVSTEFGGLKQMSPSPVGYVRYMGNEDTVQCMPQQGHFPSVNKKKKEWEREGETGFSSVPAIKAEVLKCSSSL